MARSSLIQYTRLCDPLYTASKVHHYVAGVLDKVARGEIKRLILNMPPRTGKSRLVAVEFPTYLLGLNPKAEIVSAAYGNDLVLKHSRLARARMFSDFYGQLFETRIDPTNRNIVDWHTMQGGHYRAVTVEGQLLGFGADYLLIDDPYKDFSDAHSLTIRERVWEWFLSTAYSRLSPNGAIVIIHMRWNGDDLTARLKDPARQSELEDAGAKGEKWTVINFPALALNDADELGRSFDEPLYPEKWSREKWKTIRAIEGPYKWSAIYEGNPVPRGGNYMDTDDFVPIRRDEIPDGVRWVRFWDLATSEDTKDDFTVGIKAGFKDDYMILDAMIEFQEKWPTARARIRETAINEIKQVPIIGIEAVGGFKTAFHNLVEVMPPSIQLREWNVGKDKLTRALPWIAMVGNKKVKLVHGPWVNRLKAQCSEFPAGKNDDIVDAITGCYEMVHEMPAFIPVTVPKVASALAYRRNRSLSGL